MAKSHYDIERISELQVLASQIGDRLGRVRIGLENAMLLASEACRAQNIGPLGNWPTKTREAQQLVDRAAEAAAGCAIEVRQLAESLDRVLAEGRPQLRSVDKGAA